MSATAGFRPDPRRWISLAVCCTALFMTLLDVSVVFVALPSIARSTGAGPSTLQWIVSGYTLAFGLVPVLGGRLGDDHGRRRMFQIGVGGFVVTSLLSGLSPGGGFLVTTRVLQGVAGGLINPQVSGIVQQLFRGHERGRAFGMIGAIVGVGAAIGPLIGGALVYLGGPHLGWRLVFFVNVPIGLLVLALSRRWVPSDPAIGRHKLDFGGAGLLGAAAFCILFAAVEYDQLHDPRLMALLAPAAGLGYLFYRREAALTRTRADPLVDLRLFSISSYAAGVGFAIVFFSAMAGLPFVLSIYYQQGLGYTALESGLGVMAYALGSLVAAPLVGRVVTRIGRVMVVGGAAAFFVGVLVIGLVAHMHPGHAVAFALAAPLFVAGAGSGSVITPNQALSLMEVDPVTGSTAGGALQMSQRIGLAIGQAVVGAVFFVALPTGALSLSGRARADAYDHALATATVVVLCFVTAALVVGALELRRGYRRFGSVLGGVQTRPANRGESSPLPPGGPGTPN